MEEPLPILIRLKSQNLIMLLAKRQITQRRLKMKLARCRRSSNLPPRSNHRLLKWAKWVEERIFLSWKRSWMRRGRQDRNSKASWKTSRKLAARSQAISVSSPSNRKRRQHWRKRWIEVVYFIITARFDIAIARLVAFIYRKDLT